MSKRVLTMTGLMAAALLLGLANSSAPTRAGTEQGNPQASGWQRLPSEPIYVSHFEDGKIRCQASYETPREPATRSSDELQAEATPRQWLVAQSVGNLTFVLRAGAGLQANPQAQQAYLRAAEIWSSLLDAPQPTTIVIDVDYRSTLLGAPMGIAQANPQPLIGRGEYVEWRAAVNANAASGKELRLFDALPEASVPTDLGDTDTFVMPSAVLRVAGLIPAITDPEGEVSQFGNPPAIAFINNLPWDFNPDDGITPGMVDFVGTALHEIGHVIGFLTRVGATELNPNAPLAITGFDLYRFRPGTTLETLATAKRILSAGGEHVYFAGEPELPLSTSRLNLTGGDGFGADHWKHVGFIGTRLGVMAPQQSAGERLMVSAADLMALRAMGYRLVGEARDPSPHIGSLRGDLQGDSLTVTGKVYDIDADIATAVIRLLDDASNVLREETLVVASNGEKASPFNFTLSQLSGQPTATRAEVLFRDSAGNVGAPGVANFTLGDANAPTINSVSFNGNKLVIKGKDLAGQLQVEINGMTVATIEVASNKKAKIKGNASRLNILPGANRLRISKDSKRSNVLLLNF